MSHQLTKPALPLMVAFALLAPAAVAATPPDLDGRWVLVEETYSEGASNLVAADNRIWLEFAPGTAGSSVRMWVRDGSGPGEAWPAFIDERGVLPVKVLEVRVDRIARSALAHYRVRQNTGDPLVLDVLERYSVEPSGDVLAGTVTVTFFRDERPNGSFVVHRRFERSW